MEAGRRERAPLYSAPGPMTQQLKLKSVSPLQSLEWLLGGLGSSPLWDDGGPG